MVSFYNNEYFRDHKLLIIGKKWKEKEIVKIKDGDKFNMHTVQKTKSTE